MQNEFGWRRRKVKCWTFWAKEALTNTEGQLLSCLTIAKLNHKTVVFKKRINQQCVPVRGGLDRLSLKRERERSRLGGGRDSGGDVA